MAEFIGKVDALNKLTELQKAYIQKRAKALQNGNKKEARDFESMALAVSFASDGIVSMVGASLDEQAEQVHEVTRSMLAVEQRLRQAAINALETAEARAAKLEQALRYYSDGTGDFGAHGRAVLASLGGGAA